VSIHYCPSAPTYIFCALTQRVRSLMRIHTRIYNIYTNIIYTLCYSVVYIAVICTRFAVRIGTQCVYGRADGSVRIFPVTRSLGLSGCCCGRHSVYDDNNYYCLATRRIAFTETHYADKTISDVCV